MASTPGRWILLLSIALAMPFVALAQEPGIYVPFPGAAKGVLYRPASGEAPKLAVLVMHRTGNYLDHSATRELSSRGFLVLGMNSRFDNNEASVEWEEIARDVRAGVQFLKEQEGIEHVILFGHSGGGATMSYYQALAENGPTYCQGENKLVECSDSLAGFPPADGIIFVDAHPGNTINVLRSLNPAVIEEGDALRIDSSLNPFLPENGYVADGPSTYPEEFKARYFAAQAARMNRLIDMAQARLTAMAAGESNHPDDEPFIIIRGDGARLLQLDLSIHHQTNAPRKLLRNDGSIVTQIAESVRQPSRLTDAGNRSFARGTSFMTVRSFLSAAAIRAKDSMDDIDACSSNNSTVCAVQSITVPVLFAAMGAHYFIRDNELHYELSASEDKDFIVVEGATHGISPCTACEQTPGQYSNSLKNFYDYAAGWIRERFE